MYQVPIFWLPGLVTWDEYNKRYSNFQFPEGFFNGAKTTSREGHKLMATDAYIGVLRECERKYENGECIQEAGGRLTSSQVE